MSATFNATFETALLRHLQKYKRGNLGKNAQIHMKMYLIIVEDF